MWVVTTMPCVFRSEGNRSRYIGRERVHIRVWASGCAAATRAVFGRFSASQGGNAVYTDWLIVGAGITGISLANLLATDREAKIIIIDRRRHIGGACYDSYNDAGILCHNYGPHIFHTNRQDVWSYLSQFAEWTTYQHKVLAEIDGGKVPLPFNLESMSLLFPTSLARRIAAELIDQYGYGSSLSMAELRGSDGRELRMLGEYVYKKVFEGYTLKQWGVHPDQLDASVTERVPIRISRDSRYFQDKWQGIPSEGYSAMFSRMLDRPNIRILLNADYHDLLREVRYRRLIYTGAIDEFCGHQFGALPYRSVEFRSLTYPQVQVQPVATVNYPNEHDFTRMTEMTLLTGQQALRTTLIREYPTAYDKDRNEPLYPVPAAKNHELYLKYITYCQSEHRDVVFAGRLGDYRYYNMDQAVARAFEVFREVTEV
jgi:UDP-galactopyranose mutase